ncbi:hypothetical protein EMCRGX_G018948, partial [Ephydatia muelleri]
NAQEMVSHLVVLYCSPCSASRSLLPVIVPLLPITVCSFPSLSPPSHHCPLLPITVPSSPSLSHPSHHIMLLFFPHYSQGIPSSPQSGGLPAVQVPGSVGTTWYGPGIGPTLKNNVAWTASHPPGDKLKWKALCGHLMPTEYADYVTFVFGYVHVW